MGLFSKKEDKKKKVIEPVVIEYDKMDPYAVIADVQNHLQILQKQETPFFPTVDVDNTIPSPEIFKLSLEEEINAPDVEEVQEEVVEAVEETPIEEAAPSIEVEDELVIEDSKEETQEEAPAEDTQVDEAPAPHDEPAPSDSAEESSEEVAQTEEETKADETISEEEKVEEPVAQEEAPQEDVEKEPEVTQDETPAPVEDVKEEIKEEPQKPVEEAPVEKKPVTPSQPVVMISGLTAKKKGKLASINKVKTGGVAAAKAEADKQKEAEDAKRRQEQLEKAAAIRAEEKAAEMARLANVTIIGKAKKPDPTLGKFEIQSTGDSLKPYKFVLKTDAGRVIFETAPLRTKPNELTALMFKDVLEKGSFVFLKSVQGFTFKMLDARKKEFCASKPYKSVMDAQKSAALIKKFGLSANYIDDVTN